jgi:hypothetical protein
VKWGTRYDAAYVNRLHAGVKRHISGQIVEDMRFICFTDDSSGLDEGVESRALPQDAKLWWGKAYLFSEEAGLDGHRILFLDLDQIIVGSLEKLVRYRGPFALLATDGIACELAAGGYNSSVMAWEASPFFRPIYTRLTKAALKYVHRFDHWLEMNVLGAGLWQQLAAGSIVDYTAAFLGGVCIGSSTEEHATDEEGSFVAPSESAAQNAPDTDSSEKVVTDRADGRAEKDADKIPEGAAIVTFPRNPKPHEVVDQHAWVRYHWLGEAPSHESLEK